MTLLEQMTERLDRLVEMAEEDRQGTYSDTPERSRALEFLEGLNFVMDGVLELRRRDDKARRAARLGALIADGRSIMDRGKEHS